MKAPNCPACGSHMHDDPAMNTISRFVPGIYICIQCGVAEALYGDFWQGHRTLVSPRLLLMSQAVWVKDAVNMNEPAPGSRYPRRDSWEH